MFREVLAHVRSLQVDVARRRGDAVEDGVGHQLALDAQVPLVGLELRGYERRAAPLAGLHDLEQVHRVLRADRRGHEVVDDEHLDALVVVHELEVAAVVRRTRAVEVLAYAGQPRVAHGYEPPARGVAERLHQERLATA